MQAPAQAPDSIENMCNIFDGCLRPTCRHPPCVQPFVQDLQCNSLGFLRGCLLVELKKKEIFLIKVQQEPAQEPEAVILEILYKRLDHKAGACRSAAGTRQTYCTYSQ